MGGEGGRWCVMTVCALLSESGGLKKRVSVEPINDSFSFCWGFLQPKEGGWENTETIVGCPERNTAPQSNYPLPFMQPSSLPTLPSWHAPSYARLSPLYCQSRFTMQGSEKEPRNLSEHVGVFSLNSISQSKWVQVLRSAAELRQESFDRDRWGRQDFSRCTYS